MNRYNGFTVDEMLGFIHRQGISITIETMTEYDGMDDWRVILYSNDSRQGFGGGTLFRATMKAFKQFSAAAKQERQEVQDKLKAFMGPELNFQAGVGESSDEMKLSELKILLDGANERCQMLLKAKNDWAFRGRRAEAQRDGLLAVLEAAVECGMVPTSSAREGGAMARVRHAQVADQIRDVIAQHKEAG